MPQKTLFNNGEFQVYLDGDELSIDFGLEYSVDLESLLEVVIFLLVQDWEGVRLSPRSSLLRSQICIRDR